MLGRVLSGEPGFHAEPSWRAVFALHGQRPVPSLSRALGAAQRDDEARRGFQFSRDRFGRIWDYTAGCTRERGCGGRPALSRVDANLVMNLVGRGIDRAREGSRTCARAGAARSSISGD